MEPLPRHLQQPRPSQVQAVAEIVAAYEEGARVVVLNGPTGSGKTLIAEMVRRELAVSAVYTCTTIGLQQQFCTDFTYARLLKGRANYPTMNRADKTAEDCAGKQLCFLCETYKECPYQVARMDAIDAELKVLNTAYWLAETNFGMGWFGMHREFRTAQDLVIFDEADELESSLMGFVEFRTWSERKLKNHGIDPPKKSVRLGTLISWLDDYKLKIAEWRKEHMSDAKDRSQAEGHIAEITRMQGQLKIELARGDTEEDEKVERTWIRDYTDETRLTMKPVKVDSFGQQHIWRHSDRFLLMSASMIAPAYRLATLGWTDDITVVDMPMSFPIENRPIWLCPVARMAYKTRDEDFPRLVAGLVTISQKYPGVRILVHTVSYKLTDDLKRALRRELPLRMVLSYTKSSERDDAMRRYEEVENAILLAPSMSRGYDFKDDLARVVVLCKTPFASIGDRQVSARLHSSDGRMWYDVAAVSEMVQMTGRGVRSEDDHCDTWILDADFAGKLWKERKDLFPRWWREAVDTMPPRELITKKVG